MIARRVRLRPPSSPFSCSGNLVQPYLPSSLSLSLSLSVCRKGLILDIYFTVGSIGNSDREGYQIENFHGSSRSHPSHFQYHHCSPQRATSGARSARCDAAARERARQGGERSFSGVPLSDAVGFVGGMRPRPTFARSFRESQSAIRSDSREAHSQFLILLHERSHEGVVLHAAQEFEVVTGDHVLSSGGGGLPVLCGPTQWRPIA